jgi:hypothetical protein
MALAYKVYESVMNQVDYPFFYKRKFPKVFFIYKDMFNMMIYNICLINQISNNRIQDLIKIN